MRMQNATRYSEPPAGLVERTPEGLTIVVVVHRASEGPRVEDLVPVETYLSPLAWNAAIVRAVAELDASKDERRALLAELDLDGDLSAVCEMRRRGLPSYARRLPAEVARDLLAYHREWSERGHSTSIARAYPEAGR